MQQTCSMAWTSSNKRSGVAALTYHFKECASMCEDNVITAVSDHSQLLAPLVKYGQIQWSTGKYYKEITYNQIWWKEYSYCPTHFTFTVRLHKCFMPLTIRERCNLRRPRNPCKATALWSLSSWTKQLWSALIQTSCMWPSLMRNSEADLTKHWPGGEERPAGGPGEQGCVMPKSRSWGWKMFYRTHKQPRKRTSLCRDSNETIKEKSREAPA